jgi:hypothetical protein
MIVYVKNDQFIVRFIELYNKKNSIPFLSRSQRRVACKPSFTAINTPPPILPILSCRKILKPGGGVWRWWWNVVVVVCGGGVWWWWWCVVVMCGGGGGVWWRWWIVVEE